MGLGLQRGGSEESAFLSQGPFVRVLLALAALVPLAQGSQEEITVQGRADYRIEARLDGESKRLSGRLELRWTNATSEAVEDLWFHLYLNAFSNNRSTHMVEAGGKLRGVEVDSGWGWSQIRSVNVSGPTYGNEDVTRSFRYRRPDDGREEDRTVFSVDLEKPVSPGETVRIELVWESQLPRVRRRTGYKDDFLLVAQWFPKLGVYEEGRGWNCHQFHSSTEFYSDYGTYDVTLDMPIEYENRVFGSGVEVSSQPKGDRIEVRFVAPSSDDQRRQDAFGLHPRIHDFTWTADPDFVLYRQTFRFKEWAERFPSEVEKAQAALGPDEELALRDVDVYVLVHPERESQAERHYQATCAALFFYGLWFGEYPYERVTVVDPPWGGRAAGGMEYPTLFTAGTRLFTTPDMYQPESVTVHEAGHQFWYGLVGNNEFEAAWLDEGFNSYTDSEVLWRVYGPRRGTTDFSAIPVDGVRVAGLPGGGSTADLLAGRAIEIPLPFLPNPTLRPITDSGFVDLWRDQPQLSFVQQWTDPRWADRSGYLRDPDTDPIDTHAWKYADRLSYRTNSYPRPAVALRSLPAVIGYEPFLRGMRHYAKTWRYRHPYPEDFFTTFQEGAEVDVDWYFREVFQGTGTVDWSVNVEQARRPGPGGFFQSEGGEFLERPTDDGAEGEEPWRIQVSLGRDGNLALPVVVQLTFEDGEIEDMLWTREEQLSRSWKKLDLERSSKLVEVKIDPDKSYYLDSDLSNNSWYAESDGLTPWRWGERTLAQYQRYLHWIGGIGG